MKMITVEQKDEIIVRPMVDADVKHYFKRISTVSVWTGEWKINDRGKNVKIMERIERTPGTYCERCGRIFGNIKDGYTFSEGKPYKGFYICPSCLEDKEQNKPESAPDIEDFIKVLKKINE